MTPEVKQRIEQIRQGIVPEGYVKDKDGIYPRDWASKKIGQWLKLAERPIVLQDEEEYQLVTVRRGFGGVDSRGSFLGKNVLVKNYFIVKTGDFIISKRQIAHGACGIVPPEIDGAVVSNEYNVFLPQDGTNIQMFNLMMQLPHYKRLFYLMSDGVHIEKLLFKTQDWMKRTLAMPLLKEQKKIAEILSTQDKAIELQGRKIEELKRFKKGCLEKMFPRKGQKVPEKRFPGFTDDWEQRKLSDLIIEYKETVDSDCDLPVLTSSKTEGIVLQEEHFGRKQQHDITGYNILPRGYCTYRNRSDGADFTFNINKCCDKGIISKFYPVFYGNNSDVFFISLVLNHSEEVVHEIGYTCTGTGQKVLSFLDLQKMHITVPSYAEQKKISSYFEQLNRLITLHQRKLDEMKKQKKALMQLLLTGIVRV